MNLVIRNGTGVRGVVPAGMKKGLEGFLDWNCCSWLDGRKGSELRMSAEPDNWDGVDVGVSGPKKLIRWKDCERGVAGRKDPSSTPPLNISIRIKSYHFI